MKKVIVFGTFDLFHEGHKNFFAQAKKHGDRLIVVVARDKTVKLVKGELPINKEKVRQENVIKENIADEVILGGLKDKYEVIKKMEPDVICIGYDQKKFIEGLKKIKLKIVKLKSYKPSIYKSSILKKHKSVGAIIRKENKILMIDRAIFPLGWACPAGHVDPGEDVVKALKREVKEETNLDVIKYKLLNHEFIDWNKCSRGVMGHDWHVYEITDWKGRVKRNKKEEKQIEWKSVDEIKKLKLEKIWKVWFKKLEIL